MKHLDGLHWTLIALAGLMLLTLIALTGCPHPGPTPVPPGPVDGTSIATCADVCRRLEELGCPAAKPTAHGVACDVVCQNAQAVTPWRLDCRANAPNCSAVDHCED